MRENAERVGFDLGELLYYAIMLDDEPMIRELDKCGAEFSEQRKETVTAKGKPKDLYIWTGLPERLSAENFIPVLTPLRDWNLPCARTERLLLQTIRGSRLL